MRGYLSLLFIAFFILFGVIYGYDSGLSMPYPDVPIVTTQRPKTRDEAIEALEAYYIEQIFAQGFSLKNLSILTDEEKEEFGFQVDSQHEEEIMKKEFAKMLAKKDILKLKKKLKGNIN